MTQAELIEIMDTSAIELLTVIASMKGLLVLTEHYANPSQTKNYLTMVSTCIEKLEGIIEVMKEKIRNNG